LAIICSLIYLLVTHFKIVLTLSVIFLFTSNMSQATANDKVYSNLLCQTSIVTLISPISTKTRLPKIVIPKTKQRRLKSYRNYSKMNRKRKLGLSENKFAVKD
ncbi:MAG: hypothetical protein AB8G86_03875, partial [Saprospiraceae bacterium]